MPLKVGFGTLGEQQLARKLGISHKALKKIFAFEAHEFKQNRRGISEDEKKYGGTPTFDGTFDKRNKFNKTSGEYLVRKYGKEFGFHYDTSR